MAVKTPKDPAQLFAEVCKPLDELLSEFCFEPEEELTEGNTRLSTHRRGVDTLDVSIEVNGSLIEQQQRPSKPTGVTMQMTYLHMGHEPSVEIYNRQRSGNEWPTPGYLEQLLHGGKFITPGNTVWNALRLHSQFATYGIDTKTATYPIDVAEQILVTLDGRGQIVASTIGLLSMAKMNDRWVDDVRPSVRVTCPTHNFLPYDVVAEKRGLSKAFEVRVNGPNYAAEMSAFKNMVGAVKAVKAALAV